MQRPYLFPLIFAIGLLLGSCGTYEKDVFETEDTSFLKGITLLPTRQTISADEAVLVAQLFNSNDNTLKTKVSNRIVSSTQTLESSDGEPLMHIINYEKEGGYVVVSATTNYVPVLAFSEKGNLILAEKSPAVFYLKEIGKDVSYYKEQPDDSVKDYRQMWKSYESSVQLDYPQTKSGDITSLVSSYINQWYAAGYDYYTLSNAQTHIPSDIYSSFVSIAEKEANPDFDYMDYSFVTIGYTYVSSTTYGPLIGSSWSQHYPFADLTDDPCGCGSTAIGQIMYYYSSPEGDWDWDNIYASSGTEDTRLLIHYIKSHISPLGGYSSILIYNSGFLSQAGFSHSLISHNNNRVSSSIMNGMPVYMSGEVNNNYFERHSWVCEGYQSPAFMISNYTLWVIDIDPYPSYDYISVAGDNTTATLQPSYYYMNWGWGGSYNGWFLSDDVSPHSGLDLSTNRYDLVDIAPSY